MYCLGVVHSKAGHPAYESLPDGYNLTEQEIQYVAKKVVGAPLLVEHIGVYDAIDAVCTDGTVDRYRLIRQLAKASPDNEGTSTIVGSVVDVSKIRDGGLYVILHVTVDSVGRLVQSGKLAGLSLTVFQASDYHRKEPIEVSLTRKPLRPNSYIVFASKHKNIVTQYMRGIERGGIQDRSGSLKRPYRVLMASTASQAPDISRIMAAVDAIPDASTRDEIAASIAGIVQSTHTLSETNAKLTAANTAAVEEAKALRRMGSTVLRSQLMEVAHALPESSRGTLDDDFITRAMETESAAEVKQLWSQQLLVASAAEAGKRGPNRKRSAVDNIDPAVQDQALPSSMSARDMLFSVLSRPQ